MSNGYIRLHPKHGVNPTIPTCFWCGKDKNEVALLGAAYKEEAPMHMVLDYTPCDECEAKMAKGVAIIEAEPSPDGPKFTGRWVVVHEDVIPKMLSPDSVVKAVLAKRKALMEPKPFEDLFGAVGAEVPES